MQLDKRNPMAIVMLLSPGRRGTPIFCFPFREAPRTHRGASLFGYLYSSLGACDQRKLQAPCRG